MVPIIVAIFMVFLSVTVNAAERDRRAQLAPLRKTQGPFNAKVRPGMGNPAAITKKKSAEKLPGLPLPATEKKDEASL